MFFSFSHLAVVAVVVAVMVLAWKFERRAPPKAAMTKARPIAVRRQLLKLAALVALFLGAMAPAFSGHEAVEYIHMVSTTGLAALAYLWMFQKGGT